MSSARVDSFPSMSFEISTQGWQKNYKITDNLSSFKNSKINKSNKKYSKMKHLNCQKLFSTSSQKDQSHPPLKDKILPCFDLTIALPISKWPTYATNFIRINKKVSIYCPGCLQLKCILLSSILMIRKNSNAIAQDIYLIDYARLRIKLCQLRKILTIRLPQAIEALSLSKTLLLGLAKPSLVSKKLTIMIFLWRKTTVQ